MYRYLYDYHTEYLIIKYYIIVDNCALTYCRSIINLEFKYYESKKISCYDGW